MGLPSLSLELIKRGLSQDLVEANVLISCGFVLVNDRKILNSNFKLSKKSDVRLSVNFVSRGSLKLASVQDKFKLNFRDKNVLDVGSSTGGFSDFALQNGAKKIIAVDVGNNQLHPRLRADKRVELHENTDIGSIKKLIVPVDIILVDVSFVSLRQILPHIATLINNKTDIIALFKPQFETDRAELKSSGIIKNERIRRDVIKDFENWLQNKFLIVDKADSKILGKYGNLERFYKLRKL